MDEWMNEWMNGEKQERKIRTKNNKIRYKMSERFEKV